MPCQVLQGDTATGPATALDMRTPEAQAIAREVGPLVLRTLVRQNHWRIQGDSWGTVTADRRARAGQLVELQGVRLRIVVPTHLSALAQQQGTTARCWTSLQAASLRARPLLDKYWPAWQAGPSFLAATYERSAGTWTSPDWPSDTLGPDVEPVRPPTAAEWPTP